jgi:hypothetical protein
MNDSHGLLLILIRKCVFHLATFILRSTWMNRHNSRQGCNLDELINQSEQTHGLASHTQEIRVMGRLASTMAVSFRHEMAMFRSRSVTGLKMHRSKLIKVTIGLAKPKKEGDMPRYLLMSQERKDLQCDSKEFQGDFNVIPTRMSIFRMKGPRGS